MSVQCHCGIESPTLAAHELHVCGQPIPSNSVKVRSKAIQGLVIPSTIEIRKTDPTTGAQKGSKLARFDLIPPRVLELLAEHFGRGSLKYADRNWEKGYDWGLSFSAMMRHAWAFWRGEDIDAETGSPHLIAVAWHAFALLEYSRTHPEKDTRSKS